MNYNWPRHISLLPHVACVFKIFDKLCHLNKAKKKRAEKHLWHHNIDKR